MLQKVLLMLVTLGLCCALIACGSPSMDETEDAPLASVSEEAFTATDETSKQEKPKDQAEALLCNAAATLLAADAQVIDMFANQALAPYAKGLEQTEYGYAVSDNYYSLRDDCAYKKFSAITQLLASVYSEESGVAEEYLNNYPRFGNPVFRQNYLGGTELCYTYNAGFDTDFTGADIAYLGQTHVGEYRFQYSKGGSIYTFGMVNTEGGYRLTDSMLFVWEKLALKPSTDLITEGVGSAVTLTGDCLWINVFVTDSHSAWDEDAIASIKDMVVTAGDYIIGQAQVFGVQDLRFSYIWADANLNVAAPHYSNGADWAETAFAASTYGSYDGYVKSLIPAGFDGNYSIMFHFNKQGRSFCVPCDSYSAESGQYTNEFCAMFYSLSDDSGYFACPALYMHEFLHTYGAIDLYEEALTSKGNALAAVYFDKDIMRYEPLDIEKCNIGPLTAKLLGWSQALDSQLKAFLKERV